MPVKKTIAEPKKEANEISLASFDFKWCPETESNCRHEDFQSSALPTELSGRNRKLFISKDALSVKGNSADQQAGGVSCRFLTRVSRKDGGPEAGWPHQASSSGTA